MKTKILPLMTIFLLSLVSTSYAGVSIKVESGLKTSTNSAIEDLALTSGVAVYSETIRVDRGSGYMALLVTEDKAGGAGDVDISTEYSVDGSNWYPAYTTDMAGTITIEGNIVTTLQNVTRYIVFTPRPAKYMRIKFDPDADSEITAILIYQEDR